MKEFEVYVPLHYNDGSPVAPEVLARLKKRLVDTFGGFTQVGQRHEGQFKIGSVAFRDEITIFRVLAGIEKRPRRFFRALKKELEAELAQAEVLIVERRVKTM